MLRKRGEIIKAELGIPKHWQCSLQRIINYPGNVYLVTIDSVRPTLFLTTAMINKSHATRLKRVRKAGLGFNIKDFRVSPAINISYSNPSIDSNTFFIVQDIGGEPMMRSKRRGIAEATESLEYKVVYI